MNSGVPNRTLTGVSGFIFWASPKSMSLTWCDVLVWHIMFSGWKKWDQLFKKSLCWNNWENYKITCTVRWFCLSIRLHWNTTASSNKNISTVLPSDLNERHSSDACSWHPHRFVAWTRCSPVLSAWNHLQLRVQITLHQRYCRNIRTHQWHNKLGEVCSFIFTFYGSLTTESKWAQVQRFLQASTCKSPSFNLFKKLQTLRHTCLCLMIAVHFLYSGKYM